MEIYLTNIMLWGSCSNSSIINFKYRRVYYKNFRIYFDILNKEKFPLAFCHCGSNATAQWMWWVGGYGRFVARPGMSDDSLREWRKLCKRCDITENPATALYNNTFREEWRYTACCRRMKARFGDRSTRPAVLNRFYWSCSLISLTLYWLPQN